VIRVDQLMEAARTERLATAVLASQGVKDQNGADIKLTDLYAERVAFERKLYEDLDSEARREALMKEVRSA
jgi:hypothetical protein